MEILQHFQKQFKEPYIFRPEFTSRNFKTLSLSHSEALELPFAEDEIKQSIWSCEGSKWSVSNAINLILLLRCFGEASGLNINLSKTKIFGIGVSMAETRSLASQCHCSPGDLPFTYLGLPVGENMKLLKRLKIVEAKLSSKLSIWAAKILSIGGRYTLLKSVLNSLPLYYFSLFHAPVGIINRLEILRNKFLWVSIGSSRKMIWASSRKMFGDFETGGLKIGSFAAKNMALLEKWWWRFRNESKSLWSRLIASVCGNDGVQTIPQSSIKGAVWPYILSAGLEIETAGLPFLHCFHRSVGKGDSILA